MASTGFSARVGRIKPVIGGVRSVLKSDGVAQMLGVQAQRAAARCCVLYSLKGTPTVPPYVGEIVQRGYTAGGLVRVNSPSAVIDNRRNNTLKKGCGI